MATEGRGRSLTKSKLVLVRGARQLITLRGAPSVRRGAELSELAIIPDGAVLIDDGVIEEVGPTRRIERLKAARDAAEVDATNSIVFARVRRQRYPASLRSCDGHKLPEWNYRLRGSKTQRP